MINITCKLSKSESFKAQGAFTDPCVAPTGSAMLFDLHLDSFASCIPSHNISSQEGFTLDSMRSPSFGVTESANGAGRPLQRKWSRAHMCKRMVNAALWLDGLLVNKKKTSAFSTVALGRTTFILEYHAWFMDVIKTRVWRRWNLFGFVCLCTASPDCSPSNIHPEEKWLHLFDQESVNSGPTSQPGFKGGTRSATPHK